jgi:hypothetical protein
MALATPPISATPTGSVAELCLRSRDASRELATIDSATKDRALEAIAVALEARAARSSRPTPAISRRDARPAWRTRSWTA